MKRVEFEQFNQLNPFSVFNKGGTFKYLKKESKFSVVVSSKHCKKAVKRNKIKRRVYAIISDLIKKDPSHLSGIFYLSKLSYTLPYNTLKEYIEELYYRAYENK